MSAVTTNMGLTSWSDPDDEFNNMELDANWQAIDDHDHTGGKGVQVGVGGIAANAVTSATIAANAVTASKIGSGAVVAAGLGTSAVGSAAIGSLPAARVYNSTDISVTTSGTAQALTFNSERFDTQTLHSTGSNTERLVVPVAGVYLITGHVEWAFNATGRRRISIRLNGTTTLAHQGAMATTESPGATVQSISTLYKLAASDYVELMALQTSTAALNVTSTGNYSPEFAITWVGKG